MKNKGNSPSGASTEERANAARAYGIRRTLVRDAVEDLAAFAAKLARARRTSVPSFSAEKRSRYSGRADFLASGNSLTTASR